MVIAHNYENRYDSHVLVINRSPKGEKSNTMRLPRAFLDGAGWNETKIVSVARSEIKPCLGCFACWNKTPGTCVIHDDMSGIVAKIVAAGAMGIITAAAARLSAISCS
ncbi:MAG: NAD(P)H-dependent oxidoreductase [Synergistaceae bacterium]|nr:NAD(P)H-dependent oxidoreductase [Synergistaceae bacterium]